MTTRHTQRPPHDASPCGETSSASARMLARLFDDTRATDLRVDLSRRDVGVSEHRLDGAQIGAALDEVGRERVTQLVRRDVAGGKSYTRAPRIVAKQLPERLARHGP